jgi:hypothetical protein
MLAIDSIGVSLIGLGIAFESKFLGERSIKISEDSSLIANESKQIAQSSDEKMKSVANANFLELIDKFENRRLELHKNFSVPLEMEWTAWKCLNYVEWALELKKWVKPEYQAKFVDHFERLIKSYPWRGIEIILHSNNPTEVNKLIINDDKIALIDVENILETYKAIRKFDIDKSLRDKPITLIESHIGKRREREDIDTYIDRKINEISIERQSEGKGPRSFFIKKD